MHYFGTFGGNVWKALSRKFLILEKIRFVTSIVSQNKPERSSVAFGLGQMLYHEGHWTFTYLLCWNVCARAVACAGIL